MDKSFEHIIIMHRTVEKKKFEKDSFQRSNVQNVHIDSCTFDNCDLSRSSLTNLRITNCTFINCKFLNLDLSFCKFSACVFQECDFSLSEIENNNFYNATLSNVQLSGSRLANNNFSENSFLQVDLNGSTTKFNCFENSTWKDSVFGNCTIDYNVTIGCKFIDTKMNLEALGSVWGIQEKNLENITLLSLGRELLDSREDIYVNYIDYLKKKRLCIETFTFQVSFKGNNIYESLEQLLNNLNNQYTQGQYLSPDELRYFYEILKVLRKDSMLPLLVLNRILVFYQELISKFPTEDNYYETILLFYNNICLIYNSMTHELLSYQNELLDNADKYRVKITFKEKPAQNIVNVFKELYLYVYKDSSAPEIQFVKEASGSYIVWLIMSLASIAAFNLGTLMLTGGVKHLIKLRAATEVLFSKKLPRKYYLDVYQKDDSDELAKGIISILLSGNISALSSEQRHLSDDGINAKNIQDITIENDQSAAF